MAFLFLELIVFRFYFVQASSLTVNPEEKIIKEELDKIIDPEFNAPLTEYIKINDIKIEDGNVIIETNLPSRCPYKDEITALIKEQILKIQNVKSVEVLLKKPEQKTVKEKETIVQPNKEEKSIFNGLSFTDTSNQIKNLKNYFSEIFIPKITGASVEPNDVKPGDVMIVTAYISDKFGIVSVKVDLGGIETIDLSLKDGSVNQGIWEGKWNVHDTQVKTYIAKIEAVNVLGLSSSFDVEWSDTPAWWNSNYKYRKQITVTNNTVSTLSAGYSVWISEDTATLVIATKMQDDGDDLKIVYWNGASNVELDRHLRYMDTAATEAYFKTQADIAGSGTDSNYYMYYGYSSAVDPPANGSNVYEFWEPFDNLDNWTTGGGSPSVVSGILTLPASVNTEIHHNMGYAATTYNKVLEQRVKIDLSSAQKVWWGAQMQATAFSSYFCGNQCCDGAYEGYRDLISITSVIDAAAQTSLIAIATPGTGDDTKSDGWGPGTDYNIYTEKWKASEVRYYHNQDLLWDTHAVDVTSSYNVFLQFWHYNATVALYADWYAVRKYVDPEPSSTLGGEQNRLAVGTTGTQTATVNISSTDNYIGAFTFTGSGNFTVSQIIVSEAGTVNANSNLSNLDIRYETADTCTYNGNETLFGTANSFDGSENATVTGTMSVETSQICVYVILDVGSGAANGQTIEIEITDPSTEVTVSSGEVSPATAVAISGTTTIGGVNSDIKLKGGIRLKDGVRLKP